MRESKDTEKWGAYEPDSEYFRWVRQHTPGDAATIEARLMDWADDLTYAVHDMDDFYRAGLIPLDQLCRRDDDRLNEEFEQFTEYLGSEKDPDRADALKQAANRAFGLLSIETRYQGRLDERANLRKLGSWLITRYLNAVRVVSHDDGVAYFEVDDEIEEEVAVLKGLIWFYIIERPSLGMLQRGQRRVIAELFDIYIEAIDGDVRLFPPVFLERLDSAESDDARKRIVVDLIAGMTEASAVDLPTHNGNHDWLAIGKSGVTGVRGRCQAP